MKRLVIIGAGGHAKEVAFLARRLPEYEILGFLDDNKVGDMVSDFPVIGKIETIKDLPSNTFLAFGIVNPDVKAQIYKTFLGKVEKQYEFPNLIDPTALIGSNVHLGKGNVIMAYTTLTADITIGNFNSINIACTIGHDVKVKDFNVLYPSVNISGNVQIGNNSEIGVGSQIIQDVHIGESAVIGAGTVVLKDINNNEKVVGVPGRVI